MDPQICGLTFRSHFSHQGDFGRLGCSVPSPKGKVSAHLTATVYYARDDTVGGIGRSGCQKWRCQGNRCHARRAGSHTRTSAGTPSQEIRRIPLANKTCPLKYILTANSKHQLTGALQVCLSIANRREISVLSVQEAVRQATEQVQLLGVQPGDVVSLAFTNTLEVCHVLQSSIFSMLSQDKLNEEKNSPIPLYASQEPS